MRVSTVSQPGRPLDGNSAPEMKNIGITSICMTPKKVCICLMRIAIITPNAVTVNASSSWSPKIPRISSAL